MSLVWNLGGGPQYFRVDVPYMKICMQYASPSPQIRFGWAFFFSSLLLPLVFEHSFRRFSENTVAPLPCPPSSPPPPTAALRFLELLASLICVATPQPASSLKVGAVKNSVTMKIFKKSSLMTPRCFWQHSRPLYFWPAPVPMKYQDNAKRQAHAWPAED